MRSGAKVRACSKWMNYFMHVCVINFPSFYSAFSVLSFLLVYIFIIPFSISVLFSQKTFRQYLSNEYFFFQRVFSIYNTCKNQLRYRRERASQTLPKNSQKLGKKVRINIGRGSAATDPDGNAVNGLRVQVREQKRLQPRAPESKFLLPALANFVFLNSPISVKTRCSFIDLESFLCLGTD